MDQVQRALSVGLFVLIAVVLALPAAAAEIVAFDAGSSGLTWQPLVPFEHGILTVGTPDGLVFHEEFGAGGEVSFNPFSQPNYQPPDGTYIWQVVLGQPSLVHPKLRAAAQAARGDGDPDIEAAHRAASARATLTQSGAFQILNGAIVPSTLVEPGAGPKGAGPRGAGPDALRQVDLPLDDPSIRQVDQVIPDDLIVQGSLCVGLDCVNNESFGFDTIRLKENNTRIKFDDTSTSTGFPANDWQLTANDSASGGSSKFSIEDITGSKVPFTITAGAATNSIFVDSTGRVGLRTSTPVLDLHVNTSNTPGARLQQNSSGGFTAQTWDIAGNEANFFVRDVTGGSRLPFRIRPGAPTSSIDISATGDVGIGTASPDGLQVNVAVAATARGVDNVRLGVSDGTPRMILEDSASATQWQIDNLSGRFRIFTSVERVTVTSTGNVGIGVTNPTNPLEMGSGAFVSAAGVWTDASSRELKQDIRDLTAGEARIALEQLAPVRYTSKIDPTEKHVGFIAEDVPDLVATKDRKALSPMDIVAVLTRVVQEQQKTVEAQQKTIAELAAKIEALEAAQDNPRASRLVTPTGPTTDRQ
jgi:hypothetical protein